MVTIAQAGIDTWSPCWYVDRGSLAAGMLDELATVPTSRGKLLPDAIAGHRIGWNPGAGMLFAEGHPGEGLCAPDALPEALQTLQEAMVGAGVPVPPGVAFGDLYGGRGDGFAGIRRLDATADIAMGSPAEGLAVLAGVAAIVRDAPRGKCEVHFAVDGRSVETVYLKGLGGRKVLGRWYDKAAESCSGPRGSLIRPEDQRRWTKGTRRDAAELTAPYVRGKFQQRFAPLWQASKGVTVAGPIVLAQKLADAVEAGELTVGQAQAVAGELLLGNEFDVRGVKVSARTRRYRRAIARTIGVVLADGVLQEVEVDLHDVLDQCLETDAWERRG